MGQPNYEAAADDEYVVLPRDIFKNHFTFFIYEIFHQRLFIIWLSLFSTLLFTIFICVFKDASIDLIFGLSLVTLFVSIFVIIPLILYNQPSFDMDTKMKFLSEVIKNKPNIDMTTWEIISQHMNNFLYENNHWPTPFCFFDGKSSHRMFQFLVIRKYLGIDKTTDGQSSLEEGSRETGNGSFYNFEDYNIERYMKKARDVYNKSVDEYLKARYPDYE